MQYTIVLEPGTAGCYTARCLELPGMSSQGIDRNEALERLKEQIACLQQTRNAELTDSIHSITSEIIRIDVADAA